MPLLAMLVVAALLVGVIEVEGRTKIIGGHKASGGKTTQTSTPVTTAKPAPPPPVESALGPWNAPLPVPISQALVLPGPAHQLLIIGGEVSNGTSGYGAFLMGTSTGALRQVADLTEGVHDASGAALGDEVYVFGGKGAAVTSSVQAFAAPATPTPTPTTASPVTASSLAGPSPPTPSVPSTTSSSTSTTLASVSNSGALPEPRAGSGAVVVGAAVYIVGGYNGNNAEASVLSTSDGATFTRVATLPLAVRNPAVTAVGGEIYVFGGEKFTTATTTPTSATGPRTVPPGPAGPRTGHSPAKPTGHTGVTAGHAGARAAHQAAAAHTGGPLTSATHGARKPVPAALPHWAAAEAIQRVDPVTGQAVIVGYLPTPLEGAVAVNLEGHVYVAGGQGPAGVSGAIWGFEPWAGSVVLAGHLKVPVSGAGAAVLGETAWLVGGQAASGQFVGSVQLFRPMAG